MTTAVLPTKPQERRVDPKAARVVLLGQPKIGKTTTAAAWDPQHTLILDFEGGTRLLEGDHFVQHVNTFADLQKAVGAIVAGDHQFKTVVLDTVDALWKLCDNHVAQIRGQAAAGLVEWGKGIAEAEGLFRREVGKLLALPDMGVWFIGHTDLVDVKVGNVQMQRYVPSVDKRVRGYVLGACDYVLFAEAIGVKRVLHTQPSDRYEAGSRIPLPEPLDLDARALYSAISSTLNGAANGAAKEK